MVLAKFREINSYLNNKFFQDGAYYRIYKSFIHDRLPSSKIILNVGAGSGLILYGCPIFKNGDLKDRMLICLDLDLQRLKINPQSVKITANAEDLPFPSNSVDIIMMEHVPEHLENPFAALQEGLRVLKPSGALVFATPNRYYYSCLIAQITPLSFHKWVATLLGNHDVETDLCPTLYRFNTVRAIAQIAEEVGFRVDKMATTMEAPGYTNFLPPPLHFLFILYHKAVQTLPGLGLLHSNIVGLLIKP